MKPLQVGGGLAPTASAGVSCSGAAETGGMPMPGSGTIKNLYVLCGTGGNNVSASGVFTFRKAQSNQTVTCAVGTGTACNDTSHSFTVAAGDSLVLSVGTAARETLANCAFSAEIWN